MVPRFPPLRSRSYHRESRIGTAKLNDIDPETYLRYVLERIADHPINKIEELLPWCVIDRLVNIRVAA
jgi:hypothetical protein